MEWCKEIRFCEKTQVKNYGSNWNSCHPRCVLENQCVMMMIERVKDTDAEWWSEGMIIGRWQWFGKVVV